MPKRPLISRKKLVAVVKEMVKKGDRGKRKADVRLKFLDCFVNKKITKFKEGQYIASKDKVIREVWSEDEHTLEKWPEISDYSKKLPKKLFDLKNDQIGKMCRLINERIHGEDSILPVNEDCPFYIWNKTKDLVPIFFDLDKIKEARDEDIEGRRRKPRSIWIRDCYSDSEVTRFGGRIVEWVNGHVALDLKAGIQNDDIRIHFEPEEQELLDEARLPWNERYAAWLQKDVFTHPYPGPTYGLHKFLMDPEFSSDKMEFFLRPTDYFKFMAVQENLPKYQKEHSIDFDHCQPYPEISHSISPTAFLVVKDGKSVFTAFAKRHSSKTMGTGQGFIGLPICPTPKREPSDEVRKILNKKKKPEEESFTGDKENDKLFLNVLIRGANDELGIGKFVKEKNVKFLAFGLDTHRYLFNLIAIIKVEMPINKLESRAFFTPSGKSQFRLLPPVPFNPNSVTKFLAKIDPSDQCPTTHMAAFYALCHCFDEETAIKCFKTLK